MLALTLLGFNLGFVNPAQAQTATVSGPAYQYVDNNRTWPTSEQHKIILQWLAQAKRYSDTVRVQSDRQSGRLTITITSEVPTVSTWIQHWFSSGHTHSSTSLTTGEDSTDLTYTITTIDSGVCVSLSSQDNASIDAMFAKLQQ